MDSEWIDARTDGSDLRVGDLVRFNTRDESNTPRVVIRVENNTVITAGPQQWTRDRSAMAARWQYHAPTRAKLEAADRERVTVTSITDDTITVRPAPPPDSEPGWDHVPAEHHDVGSRFSIGHGDKLVRPGGEWSVIRGPIHITHSCSEYWVRRAAHPERVRWLEERKRAINSPPSAAYVGEESTYVMAPSLGRAVNIGIALVTRDDAHEAVRAATAQVPVARSVECLSCGTWRTSSFPVCACGETRTLAECSGFRGGIQTPDDVNALVRKIAASSTPIDPFAAVRAEAKRMMDDGADPRLVLGALDECVRREDPSMWELQLAYYTVEATKSIARGFARIALGPCYHGNRAGTCGWCALSRDRSDARAVVSHEPAWETADCEGE